MKSFPVDHLACRGCVSCTYKCDIDIISWPPCLPVVMYQLLTVWYWCLWPIFSSLKLKFQATLRRLSFILHLLLKTRSEKMSLKTFPVESLSSFSREIFHFLLLILSISFSIYLVLSVPLAFSWPRDVFFISSYFFRLIPLRFNKLNFKTFAEVS